MDVVLRLFLGPLVVSGLLLGAACAPAAAPAPTATSTKPAATAATAARPTEGPSAAAKPAASTDQTAEWEKVLAAAKKEGKVVVSGSTGDGFRNAMLAFQKTYPDIQVEFTGVKGSDFAPKIIAEREAGQYLWDVVLGGSRTPITTFKPKGILDPLKPALMLPGVLDNSKWVGGLDAAWNDNARQYVFGPEAGFMPTVMVNRSVVPESELNTIEQLVDPKWKGKIVTGNLRAAAGVPTVMISSFIVAKGEAWTRRFLDQDLTIMNDERAVIESAVRGSHPIMLMVAPGMLASFRDPQVEGLIENIKPVDLYGPGGAVSDSGTGNIVLINKAPHPNAAKVFINWQLSKEGQQAWVEATNSNSRRLDVPGPAETALKPNVKYVDTYKEEFEQYRTKGSDIAKELIK